MYTYCMFFDDLWHLAHPLATSHFIITSLPPHSNPLKVYLAKLGGFIQVWSVVSCTNFWVLPMPFVLPVSGAFCIQAALHICKEHHQWLFADLQVLFIAECIIQALNEGSILAMFVHTCLSRSGMSICTHLHSFALICMLRNSCSGTHALCALTMEVEEREEWCLLTMEDAEDSAAGLPKCTCFVESSAEHNQRLATLGKRKQQS